MSESASGGPESSITPDKIRGRLAEELREALARGESPSLRVYAKKYGLGIAEVGKVLEGVKALADAFAAKTDAVAAAVPSAPPPLPADYEVLGELGRGAMGVVYRARQRSMDRVVAVKVLRPGEGLFANLADRFRREVKALAKLRHPHIVAVHEVGEAGGHLFFAMDFVEGRTLHDLVQTGEVTPTRAVKLLVQVAGAIAYTHSHGLVHRDLKPGNILVDVKDDAYVVDFGLARDTSIDGQLTGTGQILGTPAYMSPEQAKGDAAQIGEPSDVYALGAVLYECMTGRPPFEGKSLIDTIRSVVQDEPVAPRKIDARIPRDLEVICQTAMAKSPERRYPSAQAFQEDLERFVEGLPIRARPAGAAERLARWARRNPALAASVVGAFVLLAAGLGVTSYFLAAVTQERNDKDAALSRETTEKRAKEKALADAERERDEKSAAVVRADGLRLLAHASADVGRNPARAILLAIEGARRAPGRDADTTLSAALANCYEERTFELQGGTGVATFSPDGARIAAVEDVDQIDVWDAETGAQTARLRGHAGAVKSVAFSPDGARLVSAAIDGTARVWDPAARRELLTLRAPKSGLRAASYSPDGAVIVTAGDDVRLWDASTGVLLLAMDGGPTWMDFAAFSPDGRRVVGASSAGDVRVWDREGNRIAVLQGTRNSFSAAFSRDGRRLLTPGEGGIWDLENGRKLATLQLKGHWCASFSPDGTRVATADYDRMVRLWDVATGRQLLEFAGHTDDVRDVEYSADGRLLVSCGRDETVRIWDAENATCLAVLRGHEASVSRAEFNPDATRVLTYGDDERMRTWRRTACVPSLAGHSSGLLRARFSADGSRALTVQEAEGAARVWNVRTGGLVCALPDVRDAADISPDGRFVAAARPVRRGETQALVQVRDAATGEVRASLVGHRGRDEKNLDLPFGVTDVRFSPDGRLVATASLDGTLRIWDAATGEARRVLAERGGPHVAVRFDRAGRRLVSTSRDRTAFVWDVESGACVCELAGHSAEVNSASFDPSGAWVATASADGTARIWDATTGVARCVLAGHQGAVWDAEWSPDGSVVATASADATARLWDGRTGSLLATLAAHAGRVRSVGFSPEGTRLVTASSDKTARVWDVRTGVELVSLQGHSGEVDVAAFSPDGTTILTASADARARLWPTASPLSVAERVVPRRLTLVEKRRFDAWTDDERAADAFVRRAFADDESGVAVRERIATDSSLAPSVREIAAEMARERSRPWAEVLESESWSVASLPGAAPDAYALAVRQAQSAANLAPGDRSILVTLGVAQYRAGEFAAAAATLAKSNEMHGGAHPVALAFLAMAQWKLGRTDEARKTLVLLREVMKSPAPKAQAGAFLSEAEETVGN